MEIPLLYDIVAVLGLSIVVLFLFNKIKLPTVIGFLLTGIIAGPHGFGLVKAVHEVEVLAEVGVILLLFTIGIEFSIKKLLEIKKIVFVGGLLQVGITTAATVTIAFLSGFSLNQGIFIGFLLSLSSTAIVLKLLQDKGELESPYGKASLGILIFQDIAVVPMMLLLPILTATGDDVAQSLFLLVGKGLLIILIVFVLAYYVMPHVLHHIARTRIRELFILSILVICLAVAWFTSSLGLSLALGAFLAGLIISESEYSHHALSNVLPFRDVFNSFFFISIGMLFNLGFLLEEPLLVLLIALAALTIKALVIGTAIMILGFPLRTVIMGGLALCQIGEFSFILANTGIDEGLFSNEQYQMFLAVSILTMGATPFILNSARPLMKRVLMLPLPQKIKLGFGNVIDNEGIVVHKEYKNHLIIVGFGITGRTLARVAKVAGIPYVIIEANPQTVRSEREKGEPIYFGDASQHPILEYLNIEEAKVAAIGVPDPVSARSIVAAMKEANPAIHLIVRTRYLTEMEELYKLGANEVIPEEYEASIEIFTRALKKYLVPQEEIVEFIRKIRSDSYEMLRTLSTRTTVSFSDMKLHIADIDIVSFRVEENSSIVDKTLSEIALRQKHDVTLLAIFRHKSTIANPGGNTKIQVNDVLVLFGTTENLTKTANIFSA